jgi:hypothetical protein
MELTLVAVVVIALFFDFTNGFHDTANSIATSVSTRALSPRLAVLSAAVLNFAGAFVSLKVAATVAKGIVDPEAITLKIVLAGLVGAITWNLITWYLGLPSSSSHALIGGMIGSAAASQGFDVVQWRGLYEKDLIPSLAAPFLGIVGAALIMLVILWIIRRRSPGIINRVFRRLQLVSGGFVAFTHGTNDAQKTMGIIALALVASGHLDAENFDVPLWVIACSAAATGLRRPDSVRVNPLGDCALRLPGLDHAHDLRLGARRGGDTPSLRCALGRGGEHPPCLADDDSLRSARRRRHGGGESGARRRGARLRAHDRHRRGCVLGAEPPRTANGNRLLIRLVRGVGELAKLAADKERGLLADVDRVIADPLQAP